MIIFGGNSEYFRFQIFVEFSLKLFFVVYDIKIF